MERSGSVRNLLPKGEVTRPRSLAMGAGMGVRPSPGTFSPAAVASTLRKRKSRQEAVGLRVVTNYEENLKGSGL